MNHEVVVGVLEIQHNAPLEFPGSELTLNIVPGFCLEFGDVCACIQGTEICDETEAGGGDLVLTGRRLVPNTRCFPFGVGHNSETEPSFR